MHIPIDPARTALTMLTGLTAHRTAPGVVRYADASLGFAFELRAPEACTSDAEEEVIEGGKKVEVRATREKVRWGRIVVQRGGFYVL